MDASPTDPSTADRIPDDAGIDLQQTLVRLGNDRELLRELARIVIEDAPGLLAKALRGSEPPAREEAARCAHSLKGLAANFSPAAANAAHAAEAAIRSGDRARIERSLPTLQTYIERLTAALNRAVLRELRVES